MADAVRRIAIITGSESGIGRATAVALAERGCDIGVTWHQDQAQGRATANDVRTLGRRAEVRVLDLTRLPEAADVIDDLADAFGGVDVLVNDAAPVTRRHCSTWTSRPGGRYSRPTSTARSCACRERPGAWSPTGVADGS